LSDCCPPNPFRDFQWLRSANDGRQRPSRFGNRQKLRARQSSELKKFDGVTFIEVEMHRIRTRRNNKIPKIAKTKTRNENEPPRFCCFIPHQRTDGRTGNSLINAS
jgi:hypothetical protein